jgi:hypothetical protein
MFNHDLSAIENLNPMMDTVALLKQRMGYTDKLRCCIECRYYAPEDQVCKKSNMGDIPVKPVGTCEYYKKADHVKADPSEYIYQYRIEGEKDWITVEKPWYDNIANASNVERQIITHEQGEK